MTQRKKVPKKLKHIWAKIGYAHNANFARRRARELIFSAFQQNGNFLGVCQKNYQDPTSRCWVICFPIENLRPNTCDPREAQLGLAGNKCTFWMSDASIINLHLVAAFKRQCKRKCALV